MNGGTGSTALQSDFALLARDGLAEHPLEVGVVGHSPQPALADERQRLGRIG